MKPWLELCQRCTFFCAHSLVSFCRWSLWLGLALLLGIQVYIAFAQKMPIPKFLLQSLESRLATSGISATFGNTSIDPNGRLLIENLQLSLASFDEPVATVQSLYIELNPWALIAGDVEPRKLVASGVNLRVPGMLSDSGTWEQTLRDMNFSLTPHDQLIELHYLNARLAGLVVSARGAIDTSSLPKVNTGTLPLPKFLSKNYSLICQRLIQISRLLAGIDSPQAELELMPSPDLGAIAHVTVRANRLDHVDQLPLSTGQIEINTRLPLWANTPIFARVAVAAKSVKYQNEFQAVGLRTTLLTRLNINNFEITPQHAELEIDRLIGQGFVVKALSADLELDEIPAVKATILAQLGQETVRITGTANLNERSADLHMIGKFDPALLIPIGRKIGHDIRPFLNFSSSPEFDLNLHLGPGGKFNLLEGRITAKDVYGFKVTFDHLDGHIAFDGVNFIATDATGIVGTNFVRGSYDHDITTKKFRFLLTGQLRPPDIQAWFSDWWPNFWQHFDFTAAAPDASVDVQGTWGKGYETSVFVYADSRDPVIKGVPLKHANTLIYLRPHYFDAMAINVAGETGTAKGSFIRQLPDAGQSVFRTDFDFVSSLDLNAAAGLIGPELQEIVAPFTFSSPPQIQVTGFVADPAIKPFRKINVQGNSTGNFTYHKFPLSDLSFTAEMNDDKLLVEPLQAGFAEGQTTGQLQTWGATGPQRLGFDLGLKHGNLHKASIILATYFAERRGEPPPATSAYIQNTDQVFMNLDVSAEGKVEDPLSFSGSGNAEISGKGLGEVRLLGLLSELLNFTALQFDDLRTSFDVDKDRLVFPEVSVTGSNAAVAAHGIYSLKEDTLDFKARIFPFQESKFIFKSLVGAMLTPLSNALEVKLTGKLDNPKWSFVMGPTNFLRNLTQPSAEDVTPQNQAEIEIIKKIAPEGSVVEKVDQQK